MPPRISVRKLKENSISAMLASVEIYNKPQIFYRDELCVILVINSWELAFKAVIAKQNPGGIFYKKKRGEPYLTLSLTDTLNRISNQKLWPPKTDGIAIEQNIKSLIEYRNRAIHLYNATNLGVLLYTYLQQNLINYRDFMKAHFGSDVAEIMTWKLLPLGINAPNEIVSFMDFDKKTAQNQELKTFLEYLRQKVELVEQAGGDTSSIATTFDVNLQSVKKITSADLTLGIAPTAAVQMIEKKMDPSITHPYTMTTLLKKVNEKRKGRTLTSFDYQSVFYSRNLNSDIKYVWQHVNGGNRMLSNLAANLLISLNDSEIDNMKNDFIKHRKRLRLVTKKRI